LMLCAIIFPKRIREGIWCSRIVKSLTPLRLSLDPVRSLCLAHQGVSNSLFRRT
jgi:hypothetical protein